MVFLIYTDPNGMQGCSPALLARYSFFLFSLKRPVFVVLLREIDRDFVGRNKEFSIEGRVLLVSKKKTSFFVVSCS